MMAFPTAWELLIPNFNVFTVIGVLLIILAILGAKFLALIATSLGMKPLTITITTLFFGIFFVWGISIIQDFLQSTEVLWIIGGTILLALVAFLIFGKRGQQQNNLRL